MSDISTKIKKINIANSKLPRLAVYRSNKNISAQIIDDSNGKILAASSTLKLKKVKLSDMAAQVGADITKKAIDLKIKKVVFDRSKYRYHGAVKALADAARKSGLEI
jgi:large subunit ribosomal protein L18